MCDFKAKELLQERREVAADKTMDFSDAVHRVKEIDEMRFKHQYETGCLCWHDAIAELANLPSTPVPSVGEFDEEVA